MWYEIWWKEFVLTRHDTFSKKIIFKLLVFLSYAYKFIWEIYLFLYQKKILKSKKINATVISFGNLTLGGSGKTPHVIKFLEDISFTGVPCAVLLHGYKSKTKERFTIISDGKGNIFTQLFCSDEGLLVASKNKNVVIIAGKNRLVTSKIATQDYNCKLIILDDGYQYLKIKKDIEILLIDATIPVENYRIFPAGILREDIKNINRADIVVITKVNFADAENILDIKKIVHFFCPETPIVESEYEILHLKNIFSGEIVPVEAIKNKNALIISGIADPDIFEKSIRNLSPKSLRHYRFPDHHFYTYEDINKILQKAKELNEDNIIITTEKDAVKIASMNISYPIYASVLDLKITGGKEIWEDVCRKFIT